MDVYKLNPGLIPLTGRQRELRDEYLIRGDAFLDSERGRKLMGRLTADQVTTAIGVAEARIAAETAQA